MNDNITISEAKNDLRAGWDKGIKCPCCGQLVKRYNYKLTTNMAVSLISLYRHENDEYPIHVSKIARVSSNGGQFALLRHWGLIAQAENTETHKRTSGFWYITDKGRDFVRRDRTVPSSVQMYDNKVLGFSDTFIDIKTALGTKFDYQELMGDYLISNKKEQEKLL